ncbi:MAG TPA: helix-turn-helix transcriptional regulator [Coxiellaceae bacterium]|nr:MAG: hypothetical protein A3E81_07725 [Gammaproteobacteria bacterium RIFCSPHIGHO2_12_FULL_36_30]HLB57046.1 helix-turn-helix transcriptional regulator [Coxiellaceae bacterium]
MLKQNYCLTAHEAVYEIAKPIMIYLALQCFQYSRIYQNGSRVELATNPKHLQLAFIEKPFMRQVFTPTLASAEERYLSIPHWIASLPKAAQDPLSQQLNLHQELFNMGNEFALFTDVDNEKEPYRQVFHFFFSKNDYSALNRCFNNIEMIEKFCQYFVKNAQSIIAKASKDPIVKAWYPQQTNVIKKNSGLNNQKIKLMQLFDGNNKLPDMERLSKREIDCVYFITRGFTSKQIGKQLNLSYRTIETYIGNIKAKCSLKTKFDIAQTFEHLVSHLVAH